MMVNIAVFSLHRYDKFIRFLSDAGNLSRFYYAHRLRTDWRRLEIPRRQAVNIFTPAYLAGAHARYCPPVDVGVWYERYSALWQMSVLARWRPAPVLQTIIGYRTEKLLARARSDGAVTLAHVVTPHLGYYLEQERQELTRLGADRLKPGRGLSAVQERQYADADYFLVDSAFSRRTLTGAGIDGKRVFVLPPAMSPPAPAAPDPVPGVPAADGVFRVVVAARIDAMKGHRYLLEAWRRLALPNAELVFVGSLTPVAAAVLAGYEGLFRHVPHCSAAGVAAWMRSAAVVALPTLADGWGQVVSEALACGVPVIVTENAGAADCVRDGWNGFIVPARDPDALAHALEKLYRDPELRHAMAAAARQSAQSVGGWDAYAARLLEIYATIAPESVT